MLIAPTVSADGVLPGEMMPPTTGRPSAVLPMLPAAATTTSPRRDRALHRLAQRIVAVGFEHRVPERQVDDADPVLRLVRDHPVDGVDHVARVARAVRAEHAQADDVRPGRDAGVPARRRGRR